MKIEFGETPEKCICLRRMRLLPLNKCLNEVKVEWMVANKLKLNPDRTKIILFGSKGQKDWLKACFPNDIWVVLSVQLGQFRT